MMKSEVQKQENQEERLKSKRKEQGNKSKTKMSQTMKKSWSESEKENEKRKKRSNQKESKKKTMYQDKICLTVCLIKGRYVVCQREGEGEENQEAVEGEPSSYTLLMSTIPTPHFAF